MLINQSIIPMKARTFKIIKNGIHQINTSFLLEAEEIDVSTFRPFAVAKD